MLTQEDLRYWQAKIEDEARAYGLDFFETRFEVEVVITGFFGVQPATGDERAYIQTDSLIESRHISDFTRLGHLIKIGFQSRPRPTIFFLFSRNAT